MTNRKTPIKWPVKGLPIQIIADKGSAFRADFKSFDEKQLASKKVNKIANEASYKGGHKL